MKKFLFCLSMLFVAAGVFVTTSCDDEDVLNEYYQTSVTAPNPDAGYHYVYIVNGETMTAQEFADALESFNLPLDVTIALVDENGNVIDKETSKILPETGTQDIVFPVGGDRTVTVPIVVVKRGSHSGGLIK